MPCTCLFGGYSYSHKMPTCDKQYKVPGIVSFAFEYTCICQRYHTCNHKIHIMKYDNSKELLK